jgi:hypothetical protein
LKLYLQFVIIDEQQIRGQYRPLNVMPPRFITFFKLFKKFIAGNIGGIQLQQGRVPGQVIKQRTGGFTEQW